MTGPTIAGSANIKSEIGANALVSDAFTPADGEVLTVMAGTWTTGVAPGTPSGGGLTWTQRVLEAGGSFNGRVEIWTAKVATSPGSMQVTMSAPLSSCHHVMVLVRHTGADLAGSPVTGSGFTNSSSAPSASLTTTAADSAILFVDYDGNSTDPASRAYLSPATELALDDRHVGASGVFYFGVLAVPAAGATTFGLSAPATQRWNIAGIEILASAVTASAVLAGSAPVATGALTATAIQPAALAGTSAGAVGALVATATYQGLLAGTSPLATGALAATAVNPGALAGTAPFARGALNDAVIADLVGPIRGGATVTLGVGPRATTAVVTA